MNLHEQQTFTSLHASGVLFVEFSYNPQLFSGIQWLDADAEIPRSRW